jgi:GTPase SAR1 family protein
LIISTAGNACVNQVIHIGGEGVELGIWDNPTQEQFTSSSAHFVHDADCSIVISDLGA